MKFRFVLGAFFLVLSAGGTGLVTLHRSNARLEARRAGERRQRENHAAAAASAASPRETPATSSARPPLAPDESRERLDRLRADVAALEAKAERDAAHLEPTDAPSTNRDPEQGMTKLEYFRNVGQATPAAALQTLFWAALKGEDAAMAHTIAWDDTVRPAAQALIETLPAEVRDRYPTPEALAALSITRHALEVSAIRIVDTVPQDDTHASLTVQGLTGGDEHLPMHRGPEGWQLVAGEPMLELLRAELAGKK